MFLGGFIIPSPLFVGNLNTRWRSYSLLIIFANISHEVFRLVLHSLIDHPCVISLGLDTLDLRGSLKTNIKDSLAVLRQVHEGFRNGLDVLWVHIISISLDESGVASELISRSRDTHSNQWSFVLYDTVLDRFQYFWSRIKRSRNKFLFDVFLLWLTIVAFFCSGNVVL